MAKKWNETVELIELRQAVIDHCKGLRATCNALMKPGKSAKVKAVRLLDRAVDSLYKVSLDHAVARGYKPPRRATRSRAARRK